ncbi:hypothetical protein CTI12_AA432400 [Artemisia annua]|uniref:DUF4283 domain-containing protein n=1 Tax=Artemisia annua TaxID=35608 RepID=A0A2U1M0G1_ARTAN|nr:hypothetical protein CTI12_AA432400 [Artemisia annua]
MPLDSPKPPDPILEEFCTLTGMSYEGLHHKPILPNADVSLPKSRGRPKGVKNHPKSNKIKIKSPGSTSAGAGSILKRLRNSKLEGKRPSKPLPVDDVLNKVLDRIAYDKGIATQMMFKEGVKDYVAKPSNVIKGSGYCSIVGNDGSFINNPIDTCANGSDDQRNGLGNKSDVVNKGAVEFNMADVEHDKDDSTRKADKNVGDVGNENSTFVFGNVESGKGILKKPNVGLTSVQFGPSLFYKSNSAWSSGKNGAKNLNAAGTVNIESFAKKMKKGVEDRELQMIFTPQSVSRNSVGSRRIAISVDDIKKGSEACALQLYGYFVGTSMDYRVVNANLSKMWRVHGISDITKTSAGLYYFKFKSEEGMKAVLESGPWMVNNIPLVLNVWELGIWLEKVEPCTIPIWVCVYGIPMELCNGNCIGKIFSGIGKPMLMDKLTKERCLKKSGKLDFARVMVEVSAVEELPSFLEIEYPQFGERPARIGKLDVKYQWKPPLPRTEEELAAKVIIDALKTKDSSPVKGNDGSSVNDGFVEVGKNNKPVVNQSNSKQNNNVNSYVHNKSVPNSSKSNYRPYSSKQGSVQLNRGNKGGSKANDSSHKLVGNLVQKSPLSSKFNENFKPKVLVRGSGSKGDGVSAMVEDFRTVEQPYSLKNHF